MCTHLAAFGGNFQFTNEDCMKERNPLTLRFICLECTFAHRTWQRNWEILLICPFIHDAFWMQEVETKSWWKTRFHFLSNRALDMCIFLCDWFKNSSYIEIHMLIPRISEYVALHAKGNLACVIKLRTLRWGNFPGHHSKAVNHKITCIRKAGMYGSIPEEHNVIKEAG